LAVEQKILKREWEVLRGREERLTVPDPAKSEILIVLIVLERDRDKYKVCIFSNVALCYSSVGLRVSL
jgi:hypothetical protein